MKKSKRKIILWVSIAVGGFILLTVVFTFFGLNLPWTAGRASVARKPEGYSVRLNRDWYEEHSTKQYSREELIEFNDELVNLLLKFNIGFSTSGPKDEGLIEVEIFESDVFLGRAICSFYAKWRNVPIVYEIVPDGSYWELL